MGDAEPSLPVVGVAPVGVPGDPGTQSRQHPDADEQRGAVDPHRGTAVGQMDQVKEDGERPGAHRNVRYHGMQRVAKPGSIQE